MKGNISTDIQNITRLLTKQKICNDISPVTKAISNAKHGDFFQIEKFSLRINSVPRNTKPKVHSLNIVLNVSIPKIQSEDMALLLNDYFFLLRFQDMTKMGNMLNHHGI